MIRHIVMWKLDESYSTIDKDQIITELSNKLLDLKSKIAQLKSISVHTNSPQASNTNYDIMLDTTFESMEDLGIYAVHPDHLVVVEYVKTLKRERSCIDFEF